MTEAELKSFYEKLYFQEVEAREKIHARLQLPLSLILVIFGALAFLLQNYDSSTAVLSGLRIPFMFFAVCGAVCLFVATMWFIHAFYNHEYHFLPVPAKTDAYRKDLEELYRGYAEHEKLVSEALDKYIIGYYVEYASFNTEVNDRRSAYLHSCNGAIISAAILFGFAFLMFYFGELDKSKTRTVTEVVITKPITVRSQLEGK